jgi:hypothetical protein
VTLAAYNLVISWAVTVRFRTFAWLDIDSRNARHVSFGNHYFYLYALWLVLIYL